jgi:hypothetical protein
MAPGIWNLIQRDSNQRPFRIQGGVWKFKENFQTKMFNPFQNRKVGIWFKDSKFNQ